MIAAVWAGAKIEKAFKKIIPDVVKSLYHSSAQYSATGLSGYRSGHELGI